jgi:hypothetical protein
VALRALGMQCGQKQRAAQTAAALFRTDRFRAEKFLAVAS